MIDQSPAISVVVATFDRPSALARCLESLLLQSSTRTFEIIIVDNHPQSGMTAALAQTYPQVLWHEEAVSGLSRARNRGIAAALGSVIVTTDDDVVAPPEWLDRLTAPLFADGQLDLVATTGNCFPWKVETDAELVFEAYGGLRHGETAATFDAHWMAQWRVCFPQLWRIGTTANAAFRASIFREQRVGMFETRLGAGSPAGAWEDLNCFYQILQAGYRIRYIPDASLLHAHRESMKELTAQLCGYRRGEASFLVLALLRYRDWRALGQLLFWIPRWRAGLLATELWRRMRGKRRFPLSLLWRESVSYLSDRGHFGEDFNPYQEGRDQWRRRSSPARPGFEGCQ